MATGTRQLAASVAGVAAVTGLLPAASARASVTAASELELHARLQHSAQYRHASGSADFHRDDDGRELEISLRVPRLAGRWVAVYAAGQRVGKLHLSARGLGHREWDTHHGANVPSCHAGSGVRVVRAAGNRVLVASGVFHRHHHDHH